MLYIKIGAGAENRTPISSLENLHTNRCTTPASYFIITKNHHQGNLKTLPSAIVPLPQNKCYNEIGTP